jgi:hypothetical protein
MVTPFDTRGHVQLDLLRRETGCCRNGVHGLCVGGLLVRWQGLARKNCIYSQDRYFQPRINRGGRRHLSGLIPRPWSWLRLQFPRAVALLVAPPHYLFFPIAMGWEMFTVHAITCRAFVLSTIQTAQVGSLRYSV